MELVHYAADGQVATATLDSPHNRNALSKQLVSELFRALDNAEADESVKVLVLRSADRVFCSGADLSEASGEGMEEGARAIVEMQRRGSPLRCRPVVSRPRFRSKGKPTVDLNLDMPATGVWTRSA